MNASKFRALALAHLGAIESAHGGHPDFRVSGKVFASLSADASAGMVKLTPSQQRALVADHPLVFAPCAGAWGARGYTAVRLRPARANVVRGALWLAWRNTAARRLLDELDQGD